jgi:hypothetical protein
MKEYTPCEPCSKKMGAYTLCKPCYENRALVSSLDRMVEEYLKFANALGLLRVEPTSQQIRELTKRIKKIENDLYTTLA